MAAAGRYQARGESRNIISFISHLLRNSTASPPACVRVQTAIHALADLSHTHTNIVHGLELGLDVQWRKYLAPSVGKVCVYSALLFYFRRF